MRNALLKSDHEAVGHEANTRPTFARRTTDGSAGPQRRRVPSKSIRHANALMVVETGLPLLTLISTVVAFNPGEAPSAAGGFFEIRVTLKNALIGLVMLLGSAGALLVTRAYVSSAVRWFRDELIRVGVAATFGMSLAVLFPLTSPGGGVQLVHVQAAWAALLACEVLLRGGRRVRLRRDKSAALRVLVAGTGPGAVDDWRESVADDLPYYELVGFVDVAETCELVESRAERLGSIDDLEQLLMRRAIDEVFVTLPISTHYPAFQHVISVCERVGIRTKYGADIFPTTVAWASLESGSKSVVTMNVAPDDYRLVVKRAVDIVGAIAALVVLSPVMALAALAVKLTSPGPVFFSQERCGLNRRPFRMIKFRTMVPNAADLQQVLESKNEANGPVFKIARDPRITAVGRFLRKTSIDELPQLFNVLRGEMSLVGPRPLPMRDVRRFRRGTDMRRFSVTPGLTCLWQVSGRSSIGFGEWVQLDLQYIDDWSLQRDLQILVRTVPAVIRGDGAM